MPSRISTHRHVYVPGTYIVIPPKLLKYRDVYAQVGKNVFLRPEPDAKATGAGIDPKLTISQALKAFNEAQPAGGRATLESLKLVDLIQHLQKSAPTKMTRVTPEQLADYLKQKAACDKFIQDVTAKHKAFLEERNRRLIKHAEEQLKKLAPEKLAPPKD